ncbi:MAG: GDSL-type esterase/lipase family protein [Deltaproteobacteria bacterium]|nr:GDSL-type esterase/lipase family protein [Deltaproteobacteria bacterium]
MIKPARTINKLTSGAPVTIVALGDSLTQGWMVSTGYLDFLNEMLHTKFPQIRLKLINSGIPGDTADSGLYRLKWDVLHYSPDCVFIQYAINDAFSGFTEQHFKSNIKGIIDGIRENGDADIVLITSGYIGDNEDNRHVEGYYNQLEALGGDYSIPVVQTHEYWKKKIREGMVFGSLVQYDAVHPTEEGYRLMAEAVMDLF